MKIISTEDVKSKIERGEEFALIEVLSPKSYEAYHLPTAINVPVDRDEFDDNVKYVVPNKDTPVVVYCSDEQCAASAKAGRRLEELGYSDVMHYKAGKEGWRDAGFRGVQSEN